jgi:hypothetical protein
MLTPKSGLKYHRSGIVNGIILTKINSKIRGLLWVKIRLFLIKLLLKKWKNMILILYKLEPIS